MTVEVVGSSMVAAYLCQLIKTKYTCPRGCELLVASGKDGILTDFIRRQDNGALLYPTDELISFVLSTTKLVQAFWTKISE